MRCRTLRWTLLLAVVALSGCGVRGFYRDGATYQDFYRDLRECEAEVSPQWSVCTGMACQQMSDELRNRRNQCMMARNWVIRREEPKFVP